MPNCVPPLITNGNPENYLKAAFFSTYLIITLLLEILYETIFWVLKITNG